MKRLVIAVDCDDVLLPSSERFVALYNQRYGTNVELDGAHNPSNPAWQASDELRARRFDEITLSEEHFLIKPFDDAIDVCRRLSDSHDLHLVTARPNQTMLVTLAMLNEYFPGVFTEIEHVGLDGNKGEVCRRLAAHVLIDDNYRHLAAARLCGVANTIWFGCYPWQGEAAGTGDVRCYNWKEIESEIHRIAAE